MRALPVLALLLTLTACGGRSNVPPPTPLEPISEAEQVSRVWRADIAQGARREDFHLGPVVAGDRAYFADAYGTVHARRTQDGQNLWRVHMDRQISAGVAADDELALLGTPRGEVIALDADTGERLWEVSLSSEVLVPPALSEEFVFVRTVDGVVYALQRDDGSRVWTYDSSVPPLTLRGNSPPLLAHGELFIGHDNGRLEQLEPDSGEVVWSSEIAVPRGRSEIERMVDVDAGPVVHNGAVFAGAYQRRFRALSARSGDELWTRELSVYRQPAAGEDALYLSDDESVVWALEQDGGETLWRNESLRGRRLTAPVIQGEHVVVGDLEGYVHWLSRDTGRVVARVRADETGIAVAPAVAGDLVLVQSLEGAVAAYRLRES